MARPKKEGLDYFPHDTDSVNDEKIEALRMLYGNDGYAFYFILLERIYRSKDAELDVSDSETIQILSKKVGINTETFLKILETCFKRGCFDRESYENRQVLTSYGIKKRVAPVVKKREDMRKKYNQEVSDSETFQKRDKVKESKVKESKGENKERRRKSKIYDTQSVHFRLANQLYQNILKNNPDHKEPNLQKWADDVRLMMEQDGRTEEQVTYLIDWVQQDSFWKSNILSVSKLRQKYDQLVMRVKEDMNKPNNGSKPRAYQSLEDWANEG